MCCFLVFYVEHIKKYMFYFKNTLFAGYSHDSEKKRILNYFSSTLEFVNRRNE